jgi:hypothetical protein
MGMTEEELAQAHAVLASLLKNLNSMASLMPFLRASLRQTMIRKLASVGKGQGRLEESR